MYDYEAMTTDELLTLLSLHKSDEPHDLQVSVAALRELVKRLVHKHPTML